MKSTRRQLLQMGAAGALGLGAAPTILRAQGAAPTPPPPLRIDPMEGVGKAQKPLRILILGGTGFTGPHQVRYALARGHKLTLFNRGRRPKEWPGAVEELTGDRDTGDLEALRGREWDVCIDNPTTLPKWVRDAGQALQGKVGQYVFISTLSAYAKDDVPHADEGAPLAEYRGEDAMQETMDAVRASGFELYGPLKAASENEADKWFPGKVTKIRPGLIVGPGDQTDRYTYWPVRLERGGDVVCPSEGADPVQVIDARDLAEWTIRMVEAGTFGAFNAVGPGYELPIEELLVGIKSCVTSGPTLHWLPASFLEEQQVAPWGEMTAWAPASGETAGFGTRSNARAIAAGLTFRPLATTAFDTLAWFHEQPAERQAQPRAGLAPEKEAAVLAVWNARRKK